MKKPLIKLIVTQPFGVRPEYYGLGGHPGVDFRTKSIDPNNSWWNNFMGWQPIYVVENGICAVTYDKKGYGTHIWLTNTPTGNHYLYAHLKNARPLAPDRVILGGPILKFKAYEGEIIGITNNTGNSTGSHLHFGYKPNGLSVFADPMFLFQQQPVFPKVPLQISCIGSNQLGEVFKQEVMKYSSGIISLNVTNYPASYNGKIIQDVAYSIVDSIRPIEKFVFIFYAPSFPNDYYTSYYYPKFDCVITTCPGNDSRLLAFEFAHQLQFYYNEHRGNLPPVDVTDVPSNNAQLMDDLIKSKYDSVSKFYI